MPHFNILHPVCKNCSGTGSDGAGPDPLCKGTGRVPMDENAPASEWVRWIREQPDEKHGVEVLKKLAALRKVPAGLEDVETP